MSKVEGYELNMKVNLDNQKIPTGWKHGQQSSGYQGKSSFQGLHMTYVISMLVYNLNFNILDT
jgi:hypothetical protein